MNLKASAITLLSSSVQVLALSFTVASPAQAQLITQPAPSMTVADCQGGRIWRMKNGLPTCGFADPPPPPPPPPPACLYQAGVFMIHVGDMGQCTADGGCEGKGYAIYYGGLVASEMWVGYMEWPEITDRAGAAIAAAGYRLGAYITGGMSNGNNSGYAVHEVCR